MTLSMPGQPAAPSYVVEVTEATFQTEVVERSRQVPVVLDLWAEWCAPCRQLGPVLEKLAAEGAGSWVLAKIDVDANPRIAEALRVQGIPAVKAVVDGQLVDEFSGALPEPKVREWLAGLGVGTAAPQRDPMLEQAEAAELRGDLEAALSAYRDVLAEHPNDADARAGVARIELLRRAEGADAPIPDDPADVSAVIARADVELARGDAETAYARLLDAVRRTTGDDRERARRHLVGLFDVLPADDPRVTRARRELANALF